MVLLGVNIGYLAIQSVDNSPGSPWRTFAQIVSYSSILCCLANLLISSILIHRCHTRFRTMPLTVGLTPLLPTTYADSVLQANYLMFREECLFGLGSLAIEFSAPSVLFIWGVCHSQNAANIPVLIVYYAQYVMHYCGDMLHLPSQDECFHYCTYTCCIRHHQRCSHRIDLHGLVQQHLDECRFTAALACRQDEAQIPEAWMVSRGRSGEC